MATPTRIERTYAGGPGPPILVWAEVDDQGAVTSGITFHDQVITNAQITQLIALLQKAQASAIELKALIPNIFSAPGA
jgi:hypothetical protein